jgi:hypothetical protein
LGVPYFVIVDQNAINTTKLPLNSKRRNIRFQVNDILDSFGYAVVSARAWLLGSLGLLVTTLFIRLPEMTHGAGWVFNQPFVYALREEVLRAQFSLMIEALKGLSVYFLLLRPRAFQIMAQAFAL